MAACQALIQQGPHKGDLCGKLSEDKYCSKHMRHHIIDRAIYDNIRYCDVARGCYTVLESHQSKCTHCLHRARIGDRKRYDKKRQDATICLDCGRALTDEIRAKGVTDKLLRRCVPCHDTLKMCESKRTPRERNYKREACANKYVAWNHYVKSAKKKNIDFTLSKSLFNELITKACFYCNHFKGGEVNGIDRVDNNRGYIEDNVVSCCQSCNLMKGSQHPQEFIDKLYAIHAFKVSNTPIASDTIETWKTTYPSRVTPTYKAYQKSANSRNIEFKISEEEFVNIVAKECYLCGISSSDANKNGIDRFINSNGYTIDNCRPCCGHCNILKGGVAYDAIIPIAEQIAIKYEELRMYIGTKDIPLRSSKTAACIRVDNPITQESVERVYKQLHEDAVPE